MFYNHSDVNVDYVTVRILLAHKEGLAEGFEGLGSEMATSAGRDLVSVPVVEKVPHTSTFLDKN